MSLTPTCPCCAEDFECQPDCTFEKDDPAGAERLSLHRWVLFERAAREKAEAMLRGAYMMVRVPDAYKDDWPRREDWLARYRAEFGGKEGTE